MISLLSSIRRHPIVVFVVSLITVFGFWLSFNSIQPAQAQTSRRIGFTVGDGQGSTHYIQATCIPEGSTSEGKYVFSRCDIDSITFDGGNYGEL